MMSKNSIVPFLKDYLIKFLTRPFLLDTNESTIFMFTFISIMAVGVLIGYPLRRKQSIHKIPVLIQIVVCLLLFILGLSIGTNKLIIGNLSYFCQQAAIISMLSLLGSSVAALLVSHFFFKKGANREG